MRTAVEQMAHVSTTDKGDNVEVIQLVRTAVEQIVASQCHRSGKITAEISDFHIALFFQFFSAHFFKIFLSRRRSTTVGGRGLGGRQEFHCQVTRHVYNQSL